MVDIRASSGMDGSWEPIRAYLDEQFGHPIKWLDENVTYLDEGSMMAKRYSVEDLAERGGVSVDLIRSYQSKGLVPAPEHEGRRAWYDDSHLQRLRQIRDLKAQGYSLRMIARSLTEPSPPTDTADSARACRPR